MATASDPPKSAYELCREALVRVRQSQKVLHAFVHVGDSRLLEVAQALDRGGPTPLGGMPIGVKDLIDTADMPTSYGSPIYRDHRPRTDAAVVERIRAMGGIVVGKTATTEFATASPTAVRNPHNYIHTPGGSSAGSAAAVAAGLVPVAVGTQTLGSIIRPASYCGVVGFKPTFGQLPMAGIKPLAPSLDTVGLIGCTVSAVEHVYKSLCGGETNVDQASPCLGFSRGPYWTQTTPDAREAVTRAIEQLRAAGFAITDLDLGRSLGLVTEAARTVHEFEMRRSLLPEFIEHADLLTPALSEAIRTAARLTVEDHRYALQVIEEQTAAFSYRMADFDALLCPAATGEAPVGLSSTGDPIANIAWTAFHGPCVSIPVLSGERGLPIGLQVVAKRGADLAVLGLCATLLRVLGGENGRRPSLLPA